MGRSGVLRRLLHRAVLRSLTLRFRLLGLTGVVAFVQLEAHPEKRYSRKPFVISASVSVSVSLCECVCVCVCVCEGSCFRSGCGADTKFR